MTIQTVLLLPKYKILVFKYLLCSSYKFASIVGSSSISYSEQSTSAFPKALASPAYIVASLENLNEEGTDFFCPVKKCFEFACEANFRKSTIPEYKREYEEIENR